jgi:hypothetical protein
VLCGTTDRPAEVTTEGLERSPGEPSPHGEAIAEISLVSITGGLRVRDRDSRPVEGLLVEGLPPNGTIRLPVSATGRDARDHERFLLRVWPAPEAPERVIRRDAFPGNFS